MQIFLSYSWHDKKIADQINDAIESEVFFDVLRDINVLNKLESITDFMLKIRSCHYVIALISDSYLKSINCCFELTQIFYEKDVSERIIPIIYNANIFSSSGRDKIIKYWRNTQKSNEEKLISPLDIDFNKIKLVANSVETVLNQISDTNCIIYEDSSSVSALQKLIYSKVLQREIRHNHIAQGRNIKLPEAPLLSIDFGTSYTLAMVNGIDDNYLIPDENGKTIIPSIITFFQDHYLVGNNANLNIDRETITIFNTKRLIISQTSFTTNKFKISIKLLVAIILFSIKRNAEEYIGTGIEKILLSIPTDYGLKERELLKESAQIAGLDIVRIIQEASVPSMILKNDNDFSKYCVFIDIGGGTTDISYCDIGYGVYEVFITDGDRQLGSIDYDNIIINIIKSKLDLQYNLNNIIEIDYYLQYQIQIEAEKAKRFLNNKVSVDIIFETYDKEGQVKNYAITIYKTEFEDAAKDLNTKFRNILIKLLDNIKKYRNASSNEELIDELYLVGQGAKLYILRNIIQDIYDGVQIVSDFHENAVITGLAQQSGIMTGTIKEKVLLDTLHIKIYVFCSSYDLDKRILFFSDKNDTPIDVSQFRDEAYRNTCITIPYRVTIEIDLTKCRDEQIDIVLSENSLKAKSSNYISVNKVKTKNRNQLLIVDIDASSTIRTKIVCKY